MQVHCAPLGGFYPRWFVVVLVFCQCHDLPLSTPKVLRILRATPRALRHCHVISLRWPIEANSIPKLFVAALIEHLECFFRSPQDWDLKRWPITVHMRLFPPAALLRGTLPVCLRRICRRYCCYIWVHTSSLLSYSTYILR